MLAGPSVQGRSGVSWVAGLQRPRHRSFADAESDADLTIARRGLYAMRDGRAVEAQQIHARVGQYPELFGKGGTLITLK